MRLCKNNLDSKSTRTIGAERVYVSVSKMENWLSFKQHRLEFPKLAILSLNSVSTTVRLLVAVPIRVSTNISDNIKRRFGKKKDKINFAFPKSIISLAANFNRNTIHISSSFPYSSSTVTIRTFTFSKFSPNCF